MRLCLISKEYPPETEALRQRGWQVRDTSKVANTADGYQRYIQMFRGEFSCAKPSYVRLQNTWISDRTVCYLASAKPAVVRHTGESSYLPNGEGSFRSRNVEEAAMYLQITADNYDYYCQRARELAVECFDATKVVRGVLEGVL